jgi:hypothetical protein
VVLWRSLAAGGLGPYYLPLTVPLFVKIDMSKAATSRELSVEKDFKACVVVANNGSIAIQLDLNLARFPDSVIELPGLDLTEINLLSEFAAIGSDEFEIIRVQPACHLHISINQRPQTLTLSLPDLIGRIIPHRLRRASHEKNCKQELEKQAALDCMEILCHKA